MKYHLGDLDPTEQFFWKVVKTFLEVGKKKYLSDLLATACLGQRPAAARATEMGSGNGRQGR